LPLKLFVAPLALAVCIILGPTLWAEEIDVQLKISPPLSELRPFQKPATFSLAVFTADNGPVEQGWVTIQLDAPKPGRVFSTDFPIVEGSRLLEMRLPITQGRVEWRYLFPIRGEYRMTVEGMSSDGKKFEKLFRFKVRENEKKWIVLGALTAGLFCFGLVAGRVFTPPKRREIRDVTAYVFVIVGSFASWNVAAAAKDGGSPYVLRLEVEPAIVGKTSRIHWSLNRDGSTKNVLATLSLTITHLEKGETVFSVDRLPVAGEFVMNFQFADGAEHRVTAIATIAGGQMLRTEQSISVNGVEPPMRAMIPVIGFFLAVIGLGLAVGRWSRRAAPS
jgi:hypothetical protein